MQVTDRNVENLSGGELQRFAIAVVAAQAADVYMIDEPSSYLDVRQRLKAAQVRGIVGSMASKCCMGTKVEVLTGWGVCSVFWDLTCDGIQSIFGT